MASNFVPWQHASSPKYFVRFNKACPSHNTRHVLLARVSRRMWVRRWIDASKLNIERQTPEQDYARNRYKSIASIWNCTIVYFLSFYLLWALLHYPMSPPSQASWFKQRVHLLWPGTPNKATVLPHQGAEGFHKRILQHDIAESQPSIQSSIQTNQGHLGRLQIFLELLIDHGHTSSAIQDTGENHTWKSHLSWYHVCAQVCLHQKHLGFVGCNAYSSQLNSGCQDVVLQQVFPKQSCTSELLQRVLDVAPNCLPPLRPRLLAQSRASWKSRFAKCTWVSDSSAAIASPNWLSQPAMQHPMPTAAKNLVFLLQRKQGISMRNSFNAKDSFLRSSMISANLPSYHLQECCPERTFYWKQGQRLLAW